MKKTRLIIIGGFLGAGKTTCVLTIARYLMNNHKKIGIVTNDQGSQLVDTNYLRSEGLSVLEVTGGCFCCNFDEFVKRAESLAEDEAPDVILAEPVGSCTDLVATLYKPLQARQAFQFELCPLCIVADPRRVRKLMLEQEKGVPPGEINYLFQKQLEEADMILLNKADTLDRAEEELLISFLSKSFTDAVAIPASANSLHSIGFLVPILVGFRPPDKGTLEIDYGIYGRAEEKLGWLNSGALLGSSQKTEWNTFLAEFLEKVRSRMKPLSGEMAHLKVYAVSGGDYAKASLTDMEGEISFNRRMAAPSQSVSLIVNARIEVEPAQLAPAVEGSLRSLCSKWGVKLDTLQTECFKPGWPTPKYRMAGEP